MSTPPAHDPPRRRWGVLIAGLAMGLVAGAGGLGVAWVLSSGSDDDLGADHAAVCVLVARTEPLAKDFELGDMRRLAGVRDWPPPWPRPTRPTSHWPPPWRKA